MKHAPPRTTPRIAGGRVYGKDSFAPVPGNTVYKHNGKYHVYVGVNKVMTTSDMQEAIVEAARVRPL